MITFYPSLQDQDQHNPTVDGLHAKKLSGVKTNWGFPMLRHEKTTALDNRMTFLKLDSHT